MIWALIKDYGPRWTCKAGLVGALLIYLVGFGVSNFLKLGVECGHVIGSVFAAGYLVAWFYCRYVPALSGRDCCVALCLDSDCESRAIVGKIYASVRHQLAELTTSSRVKLKILPPDLIRSAERADWYIRWTGIPAVIWGTYQRQTDNGRSVERLLSVKGRLGFTTPTALVPALEAYREELNRKMSSTWHHGIRCDNTAQDLPGAVADYVDLILGGMAPVFLKAGDPLAAADACEQIAERLTSRSGTSELPTRLRELVVLALLARVENDEVEWAERLRTLQRIWALPEGRVMGVAIDAARSAWEIGDTELAKEFTDYIESVGGPVSSAAFNRAFLALYDKRYDECAKCYRNAYNRFRSGSTELNLVDLAEFLGRQWDQQKEEAGYLFAMGVVNAAGSDVPQGKRDLQRFCSVVEGKAEYSQMVECARSLLDSSAGATLSRSARRRNGTTRGNRRSK